MKGLKMTIIKRILCLFILFFLAYAGYKHEIKVAQFERTYNTAQPLFKEVEKQNKDYHSLNILDKLQVRRLLLRQIKTLQKENWTDKVIKEAYLPTLTFLTADGRPDLRTYKEHFQDSQYIASPLFKKMWQKQVKLSSAQEAQNSLTFLTNYLHMPVELKGTNQETKRLLAKFDPNLSPTDDFWNQLALLVQTAYPDDSFAQTDPLANKIHQLRYVISAQQANWVRQHFRAPKDSDADALAKYLTKLSEQDYSLTESSRYHNKVAIEVDAQGKKVPKYSDNVQQSNFKVLVHFHSEFILSESGHFLNEIDIEKRSRNSIVNSASFNYANQNDGMHRRLDIDPISSHEPAFALLAMTDGNHFFVEPSKKQQKDKRNKIFARKGKSSKQLTKEAAQKFQQLIRSYQSALGIVLKENQK